LLDDCLAELVRKGIVTYEHALAKSSNPAEFESLARRRNVLV
jgi:Tfp pilus assembly pilus retraction ATPase PilT